jgi:general secretion pathway protein N
MISLPRPLIMLTALGLVLVLGTAPTRVRTQTLPQLPQTRTQTKDQPQVQAHTPTAGPASPLAAYPLDRLSATRQRPLFSPGRRPPTQPPAPIVAAAPPPPNLILVGTIMDADDARAVVGVGTAEKTRRVRIGDDIGGWKVTQIEEQKLVLSLDDRSATFTLFSGQHAGPTEGQPSAAVRREKE